MNMQNTKKRAAGSVLFTVVAVLMIMIVFLVGTLAIASSANKRSHNSYSTTQAQYTARTGIDSVIAAVITNSDIADAVDNLARNGTIGDTLAPTIAISDTSMGNITDLQIEKVDTQMIFDEDDGTWQEKNVIKITSTAELGGNRKTVSAYLMQDPPLRTEIVTSQVTHISHITGSTSIITGTGAPTTLTITQGVTLGNASSKNNGGVLGGAVVGAGMDERVENFNITNGAYFQSPVVVNAKSSNTDAGTVRFEIGAKAQGATFMGDFRCQNPINFTYNYDQSLITKYTEQPYFYVDGEMKFTSSRSPIGDLDHAINMFCGSLDWQSGGMDLYGDLYLMDSAKSSVFGGTGFKDSKLLQWTNNFINHKETDGNYVQGSIYSKGSVQAEVTDNMTVPGSMRIEGDLTVTGGKVLNIGGDLVVGGTLTIGQGTTVMVGGQTYFDGNLLGTTNGIGTLGGTIGGTVADFTQEDIQYTLADGTVTNIAPVDPSTIVSQAVVGVKQADIYPTQMTREYITGKASAEIPTLPANFSDYKFVTIPEDLVDPTTTSKANYVTEVPSGIKSAMISYTPETIPDVITQSCVLEAGNYTKKIEIAGTGEIWVELADGFVLNSPHDMVIDDSQGLVNLFVDGTANFKGGSIYTKYYENYLNGNMGSRKLYMTEKGALLYDGMSQNLVLDPTTGKPVIDDASVPKVMIYSPWDTGVVGDTNASLHMENNALITALILAPGMSFQLDNGTNNNKLEQYYYAYTSNLTGDPATNYGCITYGKNNGRDDKYLGLIGSFTVGDIAEIRNQYMSVLLSTTTTTVTTTTITIPGAPIEIIVPAEEDVAVSIPNNYIIGATTVPGTSGTPWKIYYYENY